MIVKQTGFHGLLIIEPQVFGDGRGFFLETFQGDRYREAGVGETFVQDNLSRSSQGVIRGLHFQKNKAAGKTCHLSEGQGLRCCS